MEIENNRVVQETPNVNSNEGTPSGRSTPYVGTPSVHSSMNIGRGDLGGSMFNSITASPSANRSHSASPRSEGSTDSQYLVENVQLGTNIVVSNVMSAFREFINSYENPEHPVDEGDSFYLQKLRRLIEQEKTVFNIDLGDIRAFPQTQSLYSQIVQNPGIMINLFETTLQDLVRDIYPDARDQIPLFRVRLFNMDKKSSMRDLSTDNIEGLVCLEGMITRVGDLIPDLRIASFQCTHCKKYKNVRRDGHRIAEPERCPSCNTPGTMQVIHNVGLFADKQLIKMQEVPDSVPQGETPQAVSLYAYDDLFDSVRPGDKVEVTGIFRAIPIRINRKKTTVKDVFRTYIDVIHFRRQVDGRYVSDLDGYDEERMAGAKRGEEGREYGHADQDDTGVTGETETGMEELMEDENLREQMRALAARETIYDDLTASIAPSIWGMDDVKRGLLCMLFGGTPQDSADGPHVRSDINILLCGDPGTSKSQLLSCIHQIAPRGIYTSGKGSSAVGLTAYVTKDPETNDLILESGALVLSDKGICCIDEFDKMNDMTRSVLHEAMEQQTISVAKAGIICTLNARTSILAAANPVKSRYDPKLSVMENLQLPPTLLSRFDLIYLILDNPTFESDRDLAMHLVSLYSNSTEQTSRKAPIDKKLLTKYISYARKYIKPRLTDAAAKQLEEEYVQMRSQGAKAAAGNVITATPRQLESMIRISEALAKMRLDSEVKVEDVKEAARLINVATQRAATDPRTGVINMNTIVTNVERMEEE